MDIYNENYGGEKRGMSMGSKILIGVLIAFFLLAFYITLDANKYEATVRVIEGEGRVGINPTTERLDFGDLSPGTSAVRQVTIANETFLPMYLLVFKTGEIASLTDVSRNYFTLPKGDKATIDFSVYMPASATVDATYDGRVYIFRIPTL